MKEQFKAAAMKLPLVMALFLAFFLVNCGGGGGGGGGTSAPSTVEVVDCATVVSSATVTATDLKTFSPSSVSIPVNSVVKWISSSSLRHTVTSGTAGTPDGKFDQELLSSGSTVCLKFTVAGTYNYYCTPHFSMGMTGVVTVQ